MRQGDLVELMMKKTLCANMEKDEKSYICKILRYDSKCECIYLVLENASITEVTLDAIYDCIIKIGQENVTCTGRIKERYNDEYGQILKFEIENGFYKISVKSVDK